MSRSFFPSAVPSGRVPSSGRPGGWGSQGSSVTSVTSTAIPISTPPGVLSSGFPAPSASQPSSALAGTTHQNVNLKIALPVCLVIVGLAIILAIVRFRCIRKRPRESDEPEPQAVDPYPIDVERRVVGMTQKGDRGFAPTGITRFSTPFTHRPHSTTEVPSEREQQLGNQLTAVIQKLEALETAVQTSTGYRGSNRTSNLNEQPPDYTSIHPNGRSVEVGAGPGRDRKVEHL